MGQNCVLTKNVILVLDAMHSKQTIFSWYVKEVLSSLLVYWTTSGV